MKVILLQDVAKIGKRFDITDVPDGYALNQLIPKKMAEPATGGNLKKIEKYQATKTASLEADQAKFTEAAKALHEVSITVTADANEVGNLFKAVSEQEIADAAKAAGVEVSAAMIVVGAPIKELGEHTVSLMRGDEKAPFTIEVVKK